MFQLRKREWLQFEHLKESKMKKDKQEKFTEKNVIWFTVTQTKDKTIKHLYCEIKYFLN